VRDAKRAQTVRRIARGTLATVGIGVLFAWYLKRSGLDLTPDPAHFDRVKWWTVAAYFLLYTVVHYFRARRWDYLLRPVATVPTRRVIAIGFVGFLAIMLLPLRMGEVVRPALIREKGKISGSAALGTIAAERVLDGLYVALMLGAALLWVPRLPLDGVFIGAFPVAKVPVLGFGLVAVFAAALLVLGLFLSQRAFAERLVRGVFGLLSHKLAEKLVEKIGGLADGLRSLPDPKLMVPFTVQTLLYWSANALTMMLLGWGCGLPMTIGHAYAVMGVLAMGILLPSAPGLFGAFQFSVFAALAMYFPRQMVEHEGSAYVFLMYVCQLVFHLVAGIVPLFTEKLSLLDALQSRDSADTSTAPS
jgi:uncharacterized protein (TIRG00374 family)